MAGGTQADAPGIPVDHLVPQAHRVLVGVERLDGRAGEPPHGILLRGVTVMPATPVPVRARPPASARPAASSRRCTPRAARRCRRARPAPAPRTAPAG